MKIRPFCEADTTITAQIFYDAVHQGTTGAYSKEQREAWASQVPEAGPWKSRLASQICFVAEADDRVVGFMTMEQSGRIDLAFVAPDQMGKGVGAALYRHVEAEARKLALTKLITEASHVARPFFERRGWTMVKEQSVAKGGVSLTNFVMEKTIGAAA